ncbi:hypothetical protein CLV78_1143 [Aliiruegeria haliotis]|uniref:Uncharacterized protein n=1 Tax=Aliiruegeria haliotis TaxID=1280846 RepID=A0A2T0RGC4_9RHOB|nr:hypothetical protein CLV78_1143 [Aliiruegeria haliotis]
MDDRDDRSLEPIRQDKDIGAVPPGARRPSSPERPVVFGTPEVTILDFPQHTEGQSLHHPLIATYAVPSPGEIAVWRSSSTDGFPFLTSFAGQALTGTLVSDFYAGPISRFDHGNVLVVDLESGALEVATDLMLFGGGKCGCYRRSFRRRSTIRSAVKPSALPTTSRHDDPMHSCADSLHRQRPRDARRDNLEHCCRAARGTRRDLGVRNSRSRP